MFVTGTHRAAALRQEGHVYRPDAEPDRLRQEGYVYRRGRSERPPSVRRAISIRRIWRAGMRASGRSIKIALLTEGENARRRPIYKHWPPDGGRMLYERIAQKGTRSH